MSLDALDLGHTYTHYNNTVLSPDGVPYRSMEVPKNIDINPDDYIYWDLGMAYWKDTRTFITCERRYGALWEFTFDSQDFPRGIRVTVEDTVEDEYHEQTAVNRARTFYQEHRDPVSWVHRLFYKILGALS